MGLFVAWICYDLYQEMKLTERRDRAKKARKAREELPDYLQKKLSDPEEMERMILKAAEALKLPKEDVEKMRQELSKMSAEEKLNYVQNQLADEKMFRKFVEVLDKDVSEVEKFKEALSPQRQEIAADYLMDGQRAPEMRSSFDDNLAAQQALGQIDANFRPNF